MSDASPPSSPTAASAQLAGTSPPQAAAVAGIKAMTYAERRMSAGLLYDTSRRRTSSFGTYSRVVVIAVDQSEYSKNAFDWYLANVWRIEDLIVLVHCPEAPKLPTLSFKSGIQPPVDEWKKILDDMNTRARKLEEDYETTCTMKKLKHKVRSEAMKNIGEGICRIAEEETADLIVCGSQGTSGLKYAIKGSVCEYIMRNSPVPACIVPMKK
jgi:nucleotide-binding universal stress UspA family protein